MHIVLKELAEVTCFFVSESGFAVVLIGGRPFHLKSLTALSTATSVLERPLKHIFVD